MNRLTNKDSDYYQLRYDDKLNKLCDLEDIEEELGIDLITLFKALKNGIFMKGRTYNEGKIVYCNCPTIFWNGLIEYCEISDYGKTWALTKEELENE